VGRGRNAYSPWHMEPGGWWMVIKRTVAEITEDRLTVVAAGVAFYLLLSLFPALGASVALWGVFADPAHVWDIVDLVDGALPGEATTLLRDQLERLVEADEDVLGWSSLVGLGVSLWSANAGTKTLVTGLNVAYEERESRNLLVFHLYTLALTAMMVAAGLTATVVVTLTSALLDAFQVAPWIAQAIRLARWPVLFAGAWAVVTVLYHVGPSRKRPRWAWTMPGALLAVVLWLAASGGLSLYAEQFANYDKTYGSLAGVVLLMLWLWATSLAILLGAELNAELEHQTRVDSTVPPEAPLGKRGAYVADNVAEWDGQAEPTG